MGFPPTHILACSLPGNPNLTAEVTVFNIVLAISPRPSCATNEQVRRRARADAAPDPGGSRFKLLLLIVCGASCARVLLQIQRTVFLYIVCCISSCSCSLLQIQTKPLTLTYLSTSGSPTDIVDIVSCIASSMVLVIRCKVTQPENGMSPVPARSSHVGCFAA